MNDHEAGLSMKAHALVEAGRSLDEPSSSDRNRVRARLAATLGAAGALTAEDRGRASAADGGGAVAAIARTGFSAKLGAGLLMVATVAAAAGIVSLRAETAGVVASSNTAPSVRARAEMPSPERVPSAASEIPAKPDEPTSGDKARMRGDSSELDRAPRAVVMPVAVRRSAIAKARSKSRAVQSSAPSSGPSPTPSPTPDIAPPPPAAIPNEPSTPAATANASVAPAPPSAADDSPPQTTATPHEQAPSLAGELALLGAAQQAMASGDLAHALALLDQHAARYRTGSLVPERLAARAVTLCRMTKTAEGLRELHRLQMHSPSSPLLSWARAACPAGP